MNVMSNYDFYAALMVGFLSSGHCLGMCGGIVGAFSNNIPLHHRAMRFKLPYLISYNIGRITSYCIAGALIAYSSAFFALKSAAIMHILSLLAGLMLLAIALYIGRWVNIISKTEVIGRFIWPLISPLSKRFIPFKSPLSALPFGLIWGWLPCGLVYSTLTWAAASAQPSSGALIMLGFGLGTLPTMFSIGLVSNGLTRLLSNNIFRKISAMLIFSYALNMIRNSVTNIML